MLKHLYNPSLELCTDGGGGWGGANSLTSYEPRVYHVSYFKSCVLEHVRASLSEVSLETSRQVDKMV